MKIEHYNTENPRSLEQDIDIELIFTSKHLNQDIDIKLKSSSGIFSKNKVDRGSFNLLKFGNFDHPNPNAKVLDLGCGYGVIGITIKKMYPLYDVYLSDINERALKLARTNAKKNKVNVIVQKSDLFKRLKDEKFDIIVTNPPYVAGKKFLNSIIEQAQNHLNENGYIDVVIMYNKGGSSLEKVMLDIFGNVNTIAKKSGYRILRSYKKN